MKLNNSSLFSIVCIFLALLMLKFYFDSNVNSVGGIKDQNNPSVAEQQVDTKNTPLRVAGLPSADADIAVNYPISLSYKTKKEVYEIRKKYVAKSIFASDNYEPSDEVFGMIVDNKPWQSLNICKNNQREARVDGPSEEARFIVNPTMLVALEFPFTWGPGNEADFCQNQINQLLPKKITYSKSKNEISVYYSMLPFEADDVYFYQFNGVNAADLGYRYAYVDLNKSTYKPTFSQDENISNNIALFQNFIHLGSSCGVEGGCNNGSPRQQMLEFHVYGKPEGMIYLKLWLNRPNSYKDRADIVEKIIIGNN